MDTTVPDDDHKDKHFWGLRLTTIGKIIALVIAQITTVKVKTTVMLIDITIVNKGKDKSKVIPLQARCGPEVG